VEGRRRWLRGGWAFPLGIATALNERGAPTARSGARPATQVFRVIEAAAGRVAVRPRERGPEFYLVKHRHDRKISPRMDLPGVTVDEDWQAAREPYQRAVWEVVYTA